MSGSDTSYHQNVQSQGNSRSTSYFKGAQNLSFTNASFINVQGDYNYSTTVLTGLSSLRQQISDEAMFDSAARYSSGKCHPGTRTQVIEAIMAWINDPSPDESILWLYGSAGIGKSSIMQTIAEILNERQRGRYAASFFFANNVVGRREGSAVIPTLSYQIAINLPELRLQIEKAMEQDFTLPTKSMSVQMRSLLIDPLSIVSAQGVFRHTPTVLIDGLDECQGSTTQSHLLTLISDAIKLHQLPLRFIIASRPEYWIKHIFESSSLQFISRRISLNSSNDASVTTTNSDLAIFLRESFDKIYRNHKEVMANVQLPWPSSSIIDQLVYEASGQFIYASTILKFVGYSSDYNNPVKQLEILLTNSPSRPSAFSELDNLYSRILSVYPRPEPLKIVLAGILLRLRPLHIQNLLGIERSELVMVLNSLSSVVEVQVLPSGIHDPDLSTLYTPQSSRTTLKFSHQSFIEYLSDSRRSGPFSVDLHPFRKLIEDTLFRFIYDSLDGQASHQDLTQLHEENYYQVIANVLSDSVPGRQRVSSLLRPLKIRLESYSASVTNEFISRPGSLLCALNCVQRIIKQATISEFHHFDSLLKWGVYPKVVQFMYRSGRLQITDNLIYFSSAISNHAHLEALSNLTPGAVEVPARNFLLQNSGIVGIFYSAGGGCHYSLQPYIRDVLGSGEISEMQSIYRQNFIDVAYRCLCYILDVPGQLQKMFHAPSQIMMTFLATPGLSDIRNELDLSNLTFVSFMYRLMGMSEAELQRELGLNGWRNVLEWRTRQMVEIGYYTNLLIAQEGTTQSFANDPIANVPNCQRTQLLTYAIGATAPTSQTNTCRFQRTGHNIFHKQVAGAVDRDVKSFPDTK